MLKRLLIKAYDVTFWLMMRVLAIYEWIARAAFAVAVAIHDRAQLALAKPAQPSPVTIAERVQLRLYAEQDRVKQAMRQAKAAILRGDVRELAGDELVYVQSDPLMCGDGAGI